MKRLAWFYVGFITGLGGLANGNSLALTIERLPAAKDPSWLYGLMAITGLIALTCTVMSALCFSQALYQPRR